MQNIMLTALIAIVLAAPVSALAQARFNPGTPVLWTPPAISSGEYESSPSFTPDGREMYFFRATPASLTTVYQTARTSELTRR